MNFEHDDEKQVLNVYVEALVGVEIFSTHLINYMERFPDVGSYNIIWHILETTGNGRL